MPSRPTLASLLFDLGVDEQHLYSCNAGLLWRGLFTHHLLTDKGERFLFLVTTTGLEVGVNLSSGKVLDDRSEQHPGRGSPFVKARFCCAHRALPEDHEDLRGSNEAGQMRHRHQP